MRTVPDAPDPREVVAGTVGALLRFIDQYQIPADARLRGEHAEGFNIDLNCFEFRVTDDGDAELHLR